MLFYFKNYYGILLSSETLLREPQKAQEYITELQGEMSKQKELDTQIKMKEAKEFDDVEKMKEYIVELWNRKWHGSQKLFTTDDIVINKESAVNDDRIEWEDSMYVCVKRMGSEDYIKEYGVPQCIGICATKYKK